jgi:hypothetical protein
MKTAAGFNEGPGMIEQLRELAEAEPFKPFTIRMQTGVRYHVKKRDHIQFTHYGSPKVLAAGIGKHGHPEDFVERKQWRILNVDAIAEIIL